MRGRKAAEAEAQLRDQPIMTVPMQEDLCDCEINIDMDEEEEGIIYTQDLPLDLCVEAPEL